ncbi:hypothetical protein DYI42_05735 [Vannielia litorea]|nr:hypothetical protein [Vannielia litorea]
MNKGETKQLNRVSAQARKLLDDLEKAKEKGLIKLLEDAVEPASLEAIEATLQAMTKELGDQPESAPLLHDTSRDTLYLSFETWWRDATGDKPWILEGKDGKPPPTPFMYVANEVFNLPGMPGPTGASFKSLKDFRRNALASRNKAQRLGRKLLEVIGKDPSSGDG